MDCVVRCIAVSVVVVGDRRKACRERLLRPFLPDVWGGIAFVVDVPFVDSLVVVGMSFFDFIENRELFLGRQ